MNKSKMIAKTQEELLNSLPVEALEKLAALDDRGNYSEQEVRAILEEYGVDIDKIATSVVAKEEQNA